MSEIRLAGDLGSGDMILIPPAGSAVQGLRAGFAAVASGFALAIFAEGR